LLLNGVAAELTNRPVGRALTLRVGGRACQGSGAPGKRPVYRRL